MKTYKYTIRGRVQGVGFRYFVYRKAIELEIKGTVRNKMDGSVEVISQGDEDKINIFESLLNKGPIGARVDKVIKEEIDVEPFKNFNIIG